MREMRKAQRRKDAEWALEVFDRAPYVTVSMVRPDGTPYGLHFPTAGSVSTILTTVVLLRLRSIASSK